MTLLWEYGRWSKIWTVPLDYIVVVLQKLNMDSYSVAPIYRFLSEYFLLEQSPSILEVWIWLLKTKSSETSLRLENEMNYLAQKWYWHWFIEALSLCCLTECLLIGPASLNGTRYWRKIHTVYQKYNRLVGRLATRKILPCREPRSHPRYVKYLPTPLLSERTINNV